MGKAIQDNNIGYNILSPIVQFAMRCHYQSFVVKGIENLPEEGAYIIAPCHQQALMEPLAVLNFSPKPPVFLARADIFAKPAIRKILTFLKIMPVYRIRDGKDSLSKNTEIFDKSRDVLLDGFPLCLMAEGRHNNRHHLLPLVKGMFRIAGETQLKLGDYPLYIVPTGIDFDNYERPYSNLVVNIGKPIAVQPFMETFNENEPVALNRMRQALTEALLPMMHDIRDEEHYEEIITLCNVLNKATRKRDRLCNTAWNRFITRQKIAQTLDRQSKEGGEKFAALMDETRKYQAACKSVKMNEKNESEHWNPAVTLLATLVPAAIIAAAVLVPAVRWIALFWLICYPIPYLPTYLIAQKKIEDTQFRSSINFGIRFALSIVYALIISIVMACVGGAWMSNLADLGGWWGLITLALIPIEWVLAAPTINSLKAIGRNLRYWFLRLFKTKKMKEVRETFAKLKIED